jgi:hypothetical protein
LSATELTRRANEPKLARRLLQLAEVAMKLKGRLPETSKVPRDPIEKKLGEEMAELRKLREMVRQAGNNQLASFRLG